MIVLSYVSLLLNRSSQRAAIVFSFDHLRMLIFVPARRSYPYSSLVCKNVKEDSRYLINLDCEVTWGEWNKFRSALSNPKRAGNRGVDVLRRGRRPGTCVDQDDGDR